MYIAIDFDGTVVEHDYPRVGKEVPHAVNVMKRLADNGNFLILNTMRSNKELDDAVKWFNERGIPLYGINNNPDQNSWTGSPKIWGNIYIDDCGLGIPLVQHKGRAYVDWFGVENLLTEIGVI